MIDERGPGEKPLKLAATWKNLKYTSRVSPPHTSHGFLEGTVHTIICMLLTLMLFQTSMVFFLENKYGPKAFKPPTKYEMQLRAIGGFLSIALIYSSL